MKGGKDELPQPKNAKKAKDGLRDAEMKQARKPEDRGGKKKEISLIFHRLLPR